MGVDVMPRPRKRNIKSRIIRIRVSEALYRRLVDHAEKIERSISEIVRQAVREHLKNVLRKREEEY